MSITARTNPEVIVSGVVLRARDITKKATGEVLGSSLLVETPTGSIYVTAWADSGLSASAVGSDLTAYVSVSEGERGAQLTFERHVTESDLDRIGNSLAVLAK